MSLNVVEEIIVRQPPEAQAIIRALLAEITELKARIEELERQAKGKTPQNSSLPPSTQGTKNGTKNGTGRKTGQVRYWRYGGHELLPILT